MTGGKQFVWSDFSRIQKSVLMWYLYNRYNYFFILKYTDLNFIINNDWFVSPEYSIVDFLDLENSK